MRILICPPREIWDNLCERPVIKREDLENSVRVIINSVKKNGDKALLKYSEEFDKVNLPNLKVTAGEILNSENSVPDELKGAIKIAKSNITKFHSSQLLSEEIIETTMGVRCWRKSVAIEKVGLYIPGGSAPLFSTILMLGIPAIIAGCNEIVLCSPPDKTGCINPVLLYTAKLLGINNIFKIGGAQAIAAMAFGTESVPAVYKIFGPGNQFVTKAKECIQQEGIAIDMPAGPSEVLVIADANSNPEFIAADLLSQAEHGSDSQVILLTDNTDFIGLVREEIEKQLSLLPRRGIIETSLSGSLLISLPTLDDCIDFSNQYAPEHLIINTAEPQKLAVKVRNAGSVFLGAYSCESAGDYASGTNHTLPTNGFARTYSGLSLDSFVKKISFQEITREGLSGLGPTIEIMAGAESLEAHKNAVTVRLKSIKNG